MDSPAYIGPKLRNNRLRLHILIVFSSWISNALTTPLPFLYLVCLHFIPHFPYDCPLLSKICYHASMLNHSLDHPCCYYYSIVRFLRTVYMVPDCSLQSDSLKIRQSYRQQEYEVYETSEFYYLKFYQFE